MSKIFISIVIPVYGAPKILPVLYDRLVASLNDWAEFELIMVNDACPMGSGDVLAQLAARDTRVKYIDLMRNYGQHVAISVGLDYASGDYAVVMDCDLQDQPEEIKKLYNSLVEGNYEAVFGIRKKRKDKWFKRFQSYCFRNLYNILLEDIISVNESIGNFSIISKKVILAYRQFNEKERLYGSIIGRITTRAGLVNIEHASRLEGVSSYTTRKKIRLASSAIIANSSKPLILSIYCALILFLIAFLMAAKVVASYFFFGSSVIGWPSMMVVFCAFFGLQMLFLGIMGSYIGNIALESKRRPFYLVSKTINVNNTPKDKI